MRSEFDTLEQYQESMKEFNENTRMGFEEFIQSHGSDRNKLQLRCTPYTSKKGGYGSFDLDFGLCVYKHQQSKVDGLHKISVALNNETIRQREQVAYYLSKNAELQKRVDAVKQLIEDYRDPPTEDKTFQHALSIVTDELEQALKGGGGDE